MVARRVLAPEIGVRIPAPQPSFAKATEWHAANVLLLYFVKFEIAHFLLWVNQRSQEKTHITQ